MTDLSPQDATPRAPPAANEIEQALLGLILDDSAAYDAVADFLRPDHFSDELHGRIYEAAAKVVELGGRATVLSLRAVFEDEQPLEGMTGPQYLIELLNAAGFPREAGNYGREILDRYRRREAIRGLEATVDDLHEIDLDRPAETILEETQGALDELLGQGERGGLAPLGDHVEGALEQIEEAYKAQGTGAAAGLSTGLSRLDRKIGGFKPGKLYILAARPSMGKTALAENIAMTAARAGKRVAFFSLEMTVEDIIQREISRLTGIASDKINNGWLSEPEMDQVVGVRAALADLPLHIDDSTGSSVAGLVARARRMQRAGGLDLVIVDYLQLMHDETLWRGSTRNDQIAAITRTIKTRLAKDLEVPVLALSQLSRQVEGRDDKRPHLADLRDSGSIEQDADVVMFLYRESYYLKNETPQQRPGETTEKFDKRQRHYLQRVNRATGKGEIIVAKQRSGPIGSVHVEFDGPRMRWHEDEPAMEPEIKF